MKDLVPFMIGFCFGIMLVAASSSLLPDPGELIKKEAIQRGVARYHPQTGKWEWTAPLTDAEACKIKNVEAKP